MATVRVTARPPKKKFNEKELPQQVPKELEELTEWANKTLSEPPKPATNKVKVTPPLPASKVKVVAKAAKPVSKPAPEPEPELEEESEYEDMAAPEPTRKASNGKAKAKAPAKKKKVVVVSRKDTANMSSSMLRQTLDISRLEYGDPGIVGAGEAGSLVMGIQMPFLFQFLLQSDVFPLSRMMQLVGLHKSNKSGLAFEIARWFAQAAGVTYLFENESKYSSDFAESILGYKDETGLEVFGHFPSKTQEDWQQKLTRTTFKVKMRMDKGFIEKRKNRSTGKVKEIKHPPVGRIFPVLLLVDSISGLLNEEKVGKIDKKGFASRDYATEAMYNQDFLKKTSPDLVGYPFALLVVNHLKKSKSENGAHIERRKPGGTHLGFQESYELEMTKIRGLKYVDDRPGAPSLDIRGNQIKIKCQKSGMGEEDREIQVDLTWHYDRSQIDGRVRQYSVWQWEAGLVDLLDSHEGSRKVRINEVVDVRKVNEDSWYSNVLGIKQKEAVSKAELGKLIQGNPEILRRLGELFAIKHRTEFVSGHDYHHLLHMRVKDREKLLNL